VRCVNEILAAFTLSPLSAAELRAALQNVLKDCKTPADAETLLGTDQLGNLSEDEACLPQVYHALQAKHGRGVVFKAGKKSLLALDAAQIPPGGFLMTQVCMQRIEPASDKGHAGHDLAAQGANGLLVTAYAGESGAEFDHEWLHTIVIDPRKREFFCHNLNGWNSVKHLALDAGHAKGTTGAGCIRSVVRVYILFRKQPLLLRKPAEQPLGGSAVLSKKQKKPDPDMAKQQPTAQADDTAEEQKKAAKKSAANRKKKDRKKAKKAAEQQLISQLEPEPEAPECPAQQAEAEAEAEACAAAKAADPDPNERTQQLQALTTLGVQQWSTEQVLEWVALADLPQETVSAVSTVMVALDLDGEELIHLRVKILQKLLAKHGAQDAESVSKQVIEQRDALLLLPGDSASESASPKSDLSDTLECPLCMELYCDVEPGLRVPRILTSCGHTVCHGCITKMMTRVLAEGNAKPYSCPTCSKVTKVARGKAANLAKNFALAAAAEAL
jgi:hypothetical protein